MINHWVPYYDAVNMLWCLTVTCWLFSILPEEVTLLLETSMIKSRKHNTDYLILVSCSNINICNIFIYLFSSLIIKKSYIKLILVMVDTQCHSLHKHCYIEFKFFSIFQQWEGNCNGMCSRARKLNKTAPVTPVRKLRCARFTWPLSCSHHLCSSNLLDWASRLLKWRWSLQWSGHDYSGGKGWK